VNELCGRAVAVLREFTRPGPFPSSPSGAGAWLWHPLSKEAIDDVRGSSAYRFDGGDDDDAFRLQVMVVVVTMMMMMMMMMMMPSPVTWVTRVSRMVHQLAGGACGVA
jgi:hypothetical protein